MTAPDPGLTDLIAAALVRSSPNSIDTFDDLAPHRQEAWRVRAREVALVAEQHTNGRIAELEARIANAQSLCNSTGRYNAARQKHWNIRVFACDVLAALKGRAALEGEQQ